MRDLQVRELGVVPYQESWDLQRRLVEERAAGKVPDTLLLLEHPSVVTCGRGLRPKSLVATPHPVFHVERGGDVTYHGPGQLVGYPIEDLREHGLEAERLKGFTGVWCRGKKLASIGVSARSWVSFHGFALNLTTD